MLVYEPLPGEWRVPVKSDVLFYGLEEAAGGLGVQRRIKTTKCFSGI
jgi:hypothetical protein